MKKIIILTSNLSTVGGTERVATILANAFCEIQNTKVEIVNIGVRCNEIKYILNPNIDIKFAGIYSNHTTSKLSIVKNTIVTFLRFKKYIKKHVNYNSNTTVIAIGTLLSYYLPFLFQSKNIKLIGTQHNPIRHSFLSDSFRKFVLNKLDYYIVLDDDTYEDMHKICKNMKVIPNPITINNCMKSSDLSTKNALGIGRLTYQKGFDMLIKLWKEVDILHPDWTLTIVGEGEEKENLEKLIIDLKLDGKVFIEPFTTKILDYYLNSSIFILSSRYEGFGLVLLEAQSCGLPTISFNCPTGPKNIINDDIDGYLVELDNLSQMSDKICELISDPLKRKQFSINAINNSKRFRVETITEKWKKII